MTSFPVHIVGEVWDMIESVPDQCLLHVYVVTSKLKNQTQLIGLIKSSWTYCPRAVILASGYNAHVSF